LKLGTSPFSCYVVENSESRVFVENFKKQPYTIQEVVKDILTKIQSEMTMAEEMGEGVAYSYLAQVHEYTEDILLSIKSDAK